MVLTRTNPDLYVRIMNDNQTDQVLGALKNNFAEIDGLVKRLDLRLAQYTESLKDIVNQLLQDANFSSDPAKSADLVQLLNSSRFGAFSERGRKTFRSADIPSPGSSQAEFGRRDNLRTSRGQFLAQMASAISRAMKRNL
jgi:hypothetical protein